MSIELKIAESSQKAIETLNNQGLYVMVEYEHTAPSLPEDITEFGDENLMDLYAKYVNYLEFINIQVWCAQTDRIDSETKMNLERAGQRISRKEKGKTPVTLEAEIELDPIYREKVDKYQELYNYHKLIELLSEKLSKDISFINREITRRVNTNKITGRLNSFTP
jgi:hypothetical protein